MHRNTLRYNIRKIEKILGGRMERTEVKINFLISRCAAVYREKTEG